MAVPSEDLVCGVNCSRRCRCLREPAETPTSPERGGAGISVSAGASERGVMNGFTPEEMSRGGDAAAAVAAVVAAAAAAAASAGNGAGAGAGAEVPGAGAVSAAGPPGAAGPGPGQLCCLREDGERCGRAAGNASFSKRIQKSISQKKVKIELDKSVSDGGTALPCPSPRGSGSGADWGCWARCSGVPPAPDLAAVQTPCGVSGRKQITKSQQLRPLPATDTHLQAVVSLPAPQLPTPPLPASLPLTVFPLPPSQRSGNETKGTGARSVGGSLVVAGQLFLEWRRRLCFAVQAGVWPRE